VASIEKVEALEDDHDDDQKTALFDNIAVDKESTKMSSGGSEVAIVNETMSILLEKEQNTGKTLKQRKRFVAFNQDNQQL
jgi:hypothetical protein